MSDERGGGTAEFVAAVIRLGPMRRTLRVATAIAAVLLTLVIVAVGLLTWTIHRSFPQYDGELTVPGLSGEVQVLRDGHGVPTIYADTSADLFFAQGYVHAQDRFFEMDFRRHVTAGRLAELFGADQVDTDTFIRTMGWRRVAEQELPLLDPETRRNLDSYSAGVNAYLADHKGARLSFEYWLLDVSGPNVAPEKWTAIDSLAWLKAMAWDLVGNLDQEVDRARLGAILPDARVAELYPSYPYDRHQPIVQGGSTEGSTWVPPVAEPPSAPASSPAAATASAATMPQSPSAALDAVYADTAQALGSLDGVLGPAGSEIGSNSWVVSGKLTESGLPLLANDPHLDPALPSVWYQMNLRCRAVTPECPYDVGGYTFAGFPGVIIGHTSQIAWGFTNLDPDVSDLYVERIHGDSYDTVDGPATIETRTEQIDVSGGSPVTITIRSTNHGPLISDASKTYRDAAIATQAGRKQSDVEYAMALRWTALEPGTTADAVFAFDAATNWTEFRQAAALFETPAQNLVYADVKGNIGYQAPGKIPIRSDTDGRTPVPGWTGQDEWTGYIPFQALPWELNPSDGFIVTANQAVVSPTYPYLLTDDWSYGYRSQRIRDMITTAAAAGKIDVAAMQTMQLDTLNLNAQFLVPQLPALPNDPFYSPARAELDDWDFRQPADSSPAAYFNAFWRNLLAQTFDDELPENAWPDGGDRWVEVIRELWADPTNDWWDDKTTQGTIESRDEIVQRALRDARDELTRLLAKDPASWQWGRLHTLELTNPSFGTSGIGLVERLFNRGPIRLGGGSSIVDATGWDPSDGYHVTAVPSMRMVIDMSDLDGSQWVNLTGESGHIYHEHYVDQVDLWSQGRYYSWPWSVAAVKDAADSTLTLRPAAVG